jgi:16S rRNA (cytosine1407-C5)-methyltransferase
LHLPDDRTIQAGERERGNLPALAAKLKKDRMARRKDMTRRSRPGPAEDAAAPAAQASLAAGRTFRLAASSSGAESPAGRAALELLAAEGYVVRPDFHPLAFRLEEGPAPLGSSLAARFGLLYVQDRSSMLPPLLLAPPPGATVLDMCAAPGGKTGLAALLVGREGLVVGVEPGEGRMGILRNNLRRLGLAQVATVLGAGERLAFAPESFGHILLDPPCSGWGTQDKHPGIASLWTGKKLAPLLRLQRKLLARAAALLAPGGRLLYSTCTTNPDEDERQAAWAVEELGLVLEPLAAPGGFLFTDMAATAAPGTLKVAPESEGQGFYLALLRKPEQEGAAPSNEPRAAGDGGRGLHGTVLAPGALSGAMGADWAGLPPGEVRDFGGRVYFLPSRALKLAVPGMRWQGAPLGRLRDGRFRPDGAARALLPSAPGPGAVLVDDTAPLKDLLEGRGLEPAAVSGGPCPEEGESVGLYYRGWPLGWLICRSGLLLWPEKG